MSAPWLKVKKECLRSELAKGGDAVAVLPCLLILYLVALSACFFTKDWLRVLSDSLLLWWIRELLLWSLEPLWED